MQGDPAIFTGRVHGGGKVISGHFVQDGKPTPLTFSNLAANEPTDAEATDIRGVAAIKASTPEQS